METKRVREIKASDDELAMENALKAAFTDEKDKHFVIVFCELMRTRGDAGFLTGAREFLATLVTLGVHRQQRSRMLTRLAMHNADALSDGQGVTEPSVAHFGRFLAPLLKLNPQAVIEWIEDIADGDPDASGIPQQEVQPTAFIRGVLFAPSIPHKDCGEFWTMAVMSPRFPMRVFSDPCLWCEGVILSTRHVRIIASVCSAAAEEVAAAIAAHIRDHASMRAMRESEGMPDGADRTEKFRVDLVEAAESDRHALWDGIVSSLEDTARRPLLREVFGI